MLIVSTLLLPGALGFGLGPVGIRHSLDRSGSSTATCCLRDTVVASGSLQVPRQFGGGGGYGGGGAYGRWM